MKDLTQGSVLSHIAAMAPQIFAGLIMMMLCGLIDLYFVAGLGDAALAGICAGDNAGFLINALTQVLGVGTVALISHAVGRKDQGDANLVFNQSLGLSALCGICTLIAGCMLARSYMRSVAADDAVIEAGTTYLLWFMPALALQFTTLVMASALRHRHRAADHDRPGDHRDHQYPAGAGPDCRMGHGPRVGRCRSRACEFDRGRDRPGRDVDLCPNVRTLRHHRSQTLASATGAMETHREYRAARRGRVRHHVPLYGGDLLRAPQFWRGRAGRLRHWLAAARRHPDAGAVARVRGRRHRRAEFRRRQ